jgi:hypothetical protein
MSLQKTRLRILLPAAALFMFFTDQTATRAQTTPAPAAPSSGLTLDQIFVDAKKPTAWNDPHWKIQDDRDAACTEARPYFDHAISVQELASGPAKAIHVTAYLSTAAPKTAELDLRQRVLKVWKGEFRAGACQILWSEGAVWSIKADIEFGDGKRGSLLTDGVHVRLQAHDGKIWYFRLLPAAQ